MVGEARCFKARGIELHEWLLSKQSKEGTVQIKVYEDTKIRLHFSYFKVLEMSRETCFLDPPHQCSELANKELHKSSNMDQGDDKDVEKMIELDGSERSRESSSGGEL